MVGRRGIRAGPGERRSSGSRAANPCFAALAALTLAPLALAPLLGRLLGLALGLAATVTLGIVLGVAR